MNGRRLLAVGFLAALSFDDAALAADIERDPPPSETLQMVLDRIHTHAAGEVWKQAGWTDAALEGWIDKLLKQLSETAGKELKAPLRLADVKPPDANAQANPNDLVVRGGLRVGKNLKHSIVQDSILLADGNVEVSTVRNSIIIGRSIVTASSCDSSLIVAGRYFRVSSDRVAAGTSPGSVLLSRGYGEINFARGSILCAPLGLEVVALAEGATYVNCKPRQDPQQNNGSKSVTGKPLPLGEPPASPLEKQLELVGYMTAPQGALFRFQGRRLFAEKDQPIVDENGVAVKDLAGWTLSHVDLRMALFTSGDQEACVFKAR